MIAGVGIDLFEIPRFQKLRCNPDFLNQIFSASEIAWIQKNRDPIYPPAVRFAVKEAVLKALRKGLKNGWSWRRIRIDRKLGVSFINAIPDRAPVKNNKKIHAAATHGRAFSVAISLIER
jgi:phosphopantetheine--protein transferase-like protein